MVSVRRRARASSRSLNLFVSALLLVLIVTAIAWNFFSNYQFNAGGRSRLRLEFLSSLRKWASKSGFWLSGFRQSRF
jgi:hypothetical protein